MTLRPIAQLTQSVATWNPSTSDAAEFTYVDLSAIDGEAKMIARPTRLSTTEAPSRARQLIRNGDVLVSTVRPNLNAVAVVPPHLDGATASTGFTVLRPRPALDSRYLFHWVRSRSFIADMERRATGASYPAVSDRIVKESTIPVPSVEEQRRIAAILDQADALRAKRRWVLTQLDALAQSTFHDMFGDPAANRRSLAKRRLGDLSAKFSDGPFGSNLKSSHYVDEGVRVIRLQNIGVGHFIEDDAAYISQEHFLSLSKHRCLPGDVVIGTLGDPNIRACIIPSNIPEALNKADCVQMRVNPGRADAAWVVGLLNSPGMLKIANSGLHGQTRTRIAMGQLREMRVPVPRLEEQKRFARVIDLVGLQRRQVWMGVNELESLFASLQSRAFRGDLL